jgi:hypothetical protein
MASRRVSRWASDQPTVQVQNLGLLSDATRTWIYIMTAHNSWPKPC